MKFIVLNELKSNLVQKGYFLALFLLSVAFTNNSFGQCPGVPTFTTAYATMCLGGTPTYEATATGLTPTISYSIVGTGASIDPTSGLVSDVTGPFTVRATATNSCGSEFNDFSVTIANIPQPLITAGSATTFCQGGSVLLTSNVNFGNVWSNSDFTLFTSTSSTVQAVYSGTYTVTVTDLNGCSNTSTPIVVTINTNPIPAITPTGSNVICEGESVVLTASGTTGNVWSTGETTQEITVTDASSITVTETDINGCIGTSSPLAIIVNSLPPAPTVTADGGLEFCIGDSVTLIASEIINVLWSDGTTFDPELRVGTSGDYSVTFTDANGCKSTSLPVTVLVNPLPAIPTISANGALSFCQGGEIILSSSQPTGNLWSNDSTSQTIIVSASGVFSLTYTDENGCESISAQTQVTVNQNPNPPIITSNGPLSFCPGNSVVLTSSYQTGNLWSTGETTSTITVTQGANYFVSVTDLNGCVTSSNLTLVSGLQAPVATASALDAVTVQASPAGMSYQWLDCATSQAISLAFDQTFTATQNGSYSVIVTNSSGCKDTSSCVNMNAVGINELQDSDKIRVFPNPTSERFIVSVTDNSSSLLDIVLFDATGKQVLSISNQISGEAISVSQLEAGIYTVLVKTENGISRERLVVE